MIQAIPPRKPNLRVSRTIHENPICGPTYAALARTARSARLCSQLLPAIHRGAHEPNTTVAARFRESHRRARHV
jgi:hypothetical protein